MEARRKSQGVSGFCRPPCLLRPRAELKLILFDGSTVPLRRREGLDWVDLAPKVATLARSSSQQFAPCALFGCRRRFGRTMLLRNLGFRCFGFQPSWRRRCCCRCRLGSHRGSRSGRPDAQRATREIDGLHHQVSPVDGGIVETVTVAIITMRRRL